MGFRYRDDETAFAQFRRDIVGAQVDGQIEPPQDLRGAAISARSGADQQLTRFAGQLDQPGVNAGECETDDEPIFALDDVRYAPAPIARTAQEFPERRAADDSARVEQVERVAPGLLDHPLGFGQRG